VNQENDAAWRGDRIDQNVEDAEGIRMGEKKSIDPEHTAKWHYDLLAGGIKTFLTPVLNICMAAAGH